jgi:DNA-binding transcriptional ArsR family regulator
VPKRNGKGIELLADPTRREIIALLAVGTGAPSKIAKKMGRSRPATSRQLRILHEAGLIRFRHDYVDGRSRVYDINPLMLRRITAWLAGTEVGRAFPELAGEQHVDASDTSA